MQAHKHTAQMFAESPEPPNADVDADADAEKWLHLRVKHIQASFRFHTIANMNTPVQLKPKQHQLLL